MTVCAAHWTPETIAWDETGPDGTRYALLEGRRDVAGEAFSYAFFLPAGFWDSPHSHTADARVFVLSGCLRLAYGDSFDRGAAAGFVAGSFMVVPAGAVHYDGADEDTVIIGTAVGPWRTDYLDPAAAGSAGTVVSPAGPIG